MQRTTNIYLFFGDTPKDEVRKLVAERTGEPQIAEIRTEPVYSFAGEPISEELAEKLMELAPEAWAEHSSVKYRKYYARYKVPLENVVELEDGEEWSADADYIYHGYHPNYKNDKKFAGQTWWRVRISKQLERPNAKGAWVKRLNKIRRQLEEKLGCSTFVTKEECKLVQTTICEEVE